MKAQLQPKFGRKNGSAAAGNGGDAPETPSKPTAPLASEMPPPPPIALDLAPALPADSRTDGQIVLKVEGLAQGASLNAGRNNGDRTWSVTPNEIAGLSYTLAHGPLIPHTLHVRVLSVGEDHATTLMLLETDIGTDAIASPLRLFAESHDGGRTAEAANGDDLETTAGLSKAITQSRQLARARIAAAKAAAEADEAALLTDVSPDELAGLRASVQELESRLAERERALADATAALDAERRGGAADIQARIDEARAAGERAARESAAHEMTKRERDAAAAWQREKELLLAEAKVHVEEAIENGKPEKVRAKAEAAFEKERRKLAAEADQRVAAAEKAVRAEADAALKAARKETERTLKAVRDETAAALRKAREEASAALKTARGEAAQQLADARAEWDDARAAIETGHAETLAAREAIARQDAAAAAAAAVTAARAEWQAEADAQRAAAERAAADAHEAAEARHREAVKALADDHERARAEAIETARAAAAADAEKALAAARAEWQAEADAQRDAAGRAAADALEAAEARHRDAIKALADDHERARAEAIESARASAVADADRAIAAARADWQAGAQSLNATAEQSRAEADAASRRLADLEAERDALHAELKRARTTAADEIDRAQATHDIEQAALRAELNARIEAARREGEAAGRSAATQAMAEDEDGALAAARAEWEDELSATVARVRAEAAAEAKAAQAGTLGAAVEAARAEWRIERQQAEDAAQQRLDATRRDAESAQQALRDASAAWEDERRQLLADADARIAAAGAGDAGSASAEAARRDAAVKAALADAERRWRREIDIQVDAAEKRIAALRVAAETELEVERGKAVKTALAEARTRWEAEMEERLAEAADAWQADEQERLAATQAQLEGDFSRRLETLEAKLAQPMPAPAVASAAAAPTGKANPKLARTIAQWNRTHRRRRKLPMPHIPRRLALVTICGALTIGGVIYYQKGVGLWQKYAPVVDAQVGPHATEVTAQARQIAALVEAAIRERFPAAPPQESDGIASDGDSLETILRRAWVKPEIANLRAEPSPDGALVATLARGIEVEQLGAHGPWIRVRARGAGKAEEGWMHASVLTSSAPAQPASK